MQRSNKDKNHVLVTGGAGYIGSHTCKALYHNNYVPVAYDNLVQGHRDFVRWGPFEKGDIRDSNALNAVMNKYKFQAVIHFAASAYVGESVFHPRRYYNNNVIGSLTLFDAMLQNNIDKIVFSSTCATYGNPNRFPIMENSIQMPVNPYGNTKLIIEKILQDYDTAYGIRSIALRYFNATGADPDNEVGEDHSPETHLIPLILESAATGKVITVFGNTYETPDGSCVRDYIHVSDLAEAHILALQYLLDFGNSDRINLGLNHGCSVFEVVKAAKRITKMEIPMKVGHKRIGDPAFLVSNSDKAKNLLGWKPNYEDLHQMIHHSWEWHKKRFPIQKYSIN